MSKIERYTPTDDDLQKARNVMTHEQKEMSEKRERDINMIEDLKFQSNIIGIVEKYQEKEDRNHPIIQKTIDGGTYSDRMAVVDDFNKLIDEELTTAGRGDIVSNPTNDEDVANLYFDYQEKRVTEEKEKGTFKKGIINAMKRGYLRNALALSLFSDEDIPENFRISRTMIVDELATMMSELIERTIHEATSEANLMIDFSYNQNKGEDQFDWVNKKFNRQNLQYFMQDIQKKYNISLDEIKESFSKKVSGKSVKPTHKTIN